MNILLQYFKLHFVLLILSSFLSISQTRQDYLGTAIGKDLEAVRLTAYQNLTQQIQVFISNKSSRETNENQETFRDSMFSNTVTQSFMSLTDVKEKIEKIDDETFKVTQSVSRSSVQKMFDTRRKRIVDYLNEAERMRIDSRTSSSVPLQELLDNYYQAYLLNAIYPDTLTYYFNSQQTTLEVGIPNIINEVVRSIEFIPIKQIDDEYVVWKYLVLFNGKDVSKLRYSFFDGMGQSDGEVHNGETQITLYYSKKEKSERQIQFQLEYLSSNELDNILGLAKKFISTAPLQKVFLIKIPGEARSSISDQKPPTALLGLIKAKSNFESIINEIDLLVKKGTILKGKPSDFETLNGLFCVVVDKPGLMALLRNTNNKYYDYISEKEVELKQYSGKRILWFELLKK